MRYVSIMALGPNWESSEKDGSREIVNRAHYDHMKNLFDQGRLILGGPFKRAAGGIHILECPTKSAAEEVLANDPGVKAGLFTFEVRELFTMFDALAGTCKPFPGG
jgi:uncharacterized protein